MKKEFSIPEKTAILKKLLHKINNGYQGIVKTDEINQAEVDLENELNNL
jgi:hypothetical protein